MAKKWNPQCVLTPAIKAGYLWRVRDVITKETNKIIKQTQLINENEDLREEIKQLKDKNTQNEDGFEKNTQTDDTMTTVSSLGNDVASMEDVDSGDDDTHRRRRHRH